MPAGLIQGHRQTLDPALRLLQPRVCEGAAPASRQPRRRHRSAAPHRTHPHGFWLTLEVANEKAGLCSKRAQYTEDVLNLRVTWTGDLLEPIGKVRRAQP